jgi:Spy/CpxP family protein refolding chaperone
MKTLILGLALMTGAAFAQTQSSGTQDQSQSQMGEHHRRGDRQQDMRQHMDKMATELNLSADQKTQWQGIMKDQMSQARSIRQDSSLSEDQKKAKLKELHESTQSKVNAVLTPDQQKKFADMRKDMREDRKEHRHKGGDQDNTSKK